MKNTTWREYRGGGQILNSEDVPPIAAAAREGAQEKKVLLRSEKWNCPWCAAVNAIGLAACENCGMPKS